MNNTMSSVTRPFTLSFTGHCYLSVDGNWNLEFIQDLFRLEVLVITVCTLLLLKPMISMQISFVNSQWQNIFQGYITLDTQVSHCTSQYHLHLYFTPGVKTTFFIMFFTLISITINIDHCFVILYPTLHGLPEWYRGFLDVQRHYLEMSTVSAVECR